MIKKTINIKIPEDKEECEKINCLECGLLNTDFCQEIMQAINKKVDKDSLEEQIEEVKKRVEELERSHIHTHSAPPITQPFPWTPAGPIYCGDNPIEEPYTTCDNTADLCNPQHTLTTEFKSKTQPSSFVDKNTFSIYKNNGEIIKIEFA